MGIRLDPLRELDRMAQSLGQLFNRRGPVQVSRDDAEVRLEIDLPGVRADDIELTVDVDRVVVRAVRRSAGPGPGETDLQREYAADEPIDVDGVSATYEDGLLAVRLPRMAGRRARRIPVHSSRARPASRPPGSPGDPVGGPMAPAADGAPSPGAAAGTAPPPPGEQANPLPAS